jgi:phosphoglycolate phosphatase
MDGTRADKTELLKHALDIGHVDPARAILVGDRSYDIIGARNNGMPALGVLYGYGSKEELAQAGARHLGEKPQDVLAYALGPNQTA